MKKSILLSLALVGVLSADCVRDNAKEVVTCNKTKLMWQDNADVGSVSKTWRDAIKYCEDEIGNNGIYAGYDDWRLPNIKELKSIVDKSKYSPALKEGFTQKSTNYFWSSTTDASYTSNAWNVNLGDGSANWSYKSYTYSVRCVR